VVLGGHRGRPVLAGRRVRAVLPERDERGLLRPSPQWRPEPLVRRHVRELHAPRLAAARRRDRRGGGAAPPRLSPCEDGPMTSDTPLELPGYAHLYSGKVRDLYAPVGADGQQRGGRLLLVASDRMSAYDFVLETPIPDKGAVLTQLSLWWFEQLADL